jgi:RNA polymerase sigma-70 factor (ECF subfamily)
MIARAGEGGVLAHDGQTEQLASRAASGDTVALDALLVKIQPDVLRQCARYLDNWHDAEEACQDALLQIARKITHFEGRSRFSTWLYTVVANCARQTYRSLKQRAAERPGVEATAESADPRTTSSIAGSRLDFLDALERLEAHRPELVSAIVLRDLCQLDYAEIASELGVPVGTVKSRVHHARLHIRRTLARH